MDASKNARHSFIFVTRVFVFHKHPKIKKNISPPSTLPRNQLLEASDRSRWKTGVHYAIPASHSSRPGETPECYPGVN